MKRLLRGSKHREVRVAAQHSLEGSGAIPTSGSPAVAKNFIGASRAAAELCRVLGAAVDWDEVADNPRSAINSVLERVEERASINDAMSLNHCPSIEPWDCEPSEAELIALAWDCASGAYGSQSAAETPRVELQPEFLIHASATGTTKATTGSIFRSQHSGESYLIIAVRGTVSDADHVINLHGEPVDASALFNNTEYDSLKLSAHGGFLGVTVDLMRRLKPRIEYHLNQVPDLKVLFTGHSAGGAVASLMHLAHQASYGGKYPRAAFSCITFGSPPVARVGSLHAQDAINGLLETGYVLHVINEYDFVARADRSYIRAMIRMYSAEEHNQSAPTIWRLPEPELGHIGPLIILKTSAPILDLEDCNDLQTGPAITAWRIAPGDLSHLLFCRLPVHRRTVYHDRIRQLESGTFNGRNEWPSRPIGT